MLRHIAWFNEATVVPDEAGALTSEDACVRRRCLAPARAIEEMGVGCSVFGHLHDADPVQVSRHLQKINADIVVIGNITGVSRLRLARAAKHLGCYVVADFIVEEHDKTVLSQLMQVVDQAVAANTALADVLINQSGIKAVVIADCDEKPEGKHLPHEIAKEWIDCFKQLKLKPSVGANTNVPG
jgi:hypothetical protein